MTAQKAVPKAVQDAVKKEYSHLCAICGAPNPQLHHIDEDRSNHDPENLIPLCPNDHLGPHHNPHLAIGIRRLQFFRIHKHPAILKRQFYPLFDRLGFLETLDVCTDRLELDKAGDELHRLVRSHEHGRFYGDEIQKLVQRPRYVARLDVGSGRAPGPSQVKKEEDERRRQEDLEGFRSQLVQNRDRIHQLVVELLAFQPWASTDP